MRGARLIEGDDGGGPRHFLRGRPVTCGTSLYVLTFTGWMAGRYERDGHHANFYFALPGVADDHVMRIHADMLFAWPGDVLVGGATPDAPAGSALAG